MPAWRRFPLFALGAASLIAGLLAGLNRLGGTLEVPGVSLISLHGPLMVAGFLGTVIGLERAVALRKPWGFAAPALSGAGGLALLSGIEPLLGAALMSAGSAVLAAVAVLIAVRHRALFTAMTALGALAWLAGNLLWASGRMVPEVVLFWAAFLVLTIAGERLELSRLMKPTRARAITVMAPLALLLAGLGLAGAGEEMLSQRLFGAGLLTLTAWLVTYDVARRTIRQKGLTRYMAVCLLSGYVWLGIAGAALLAHGIPWAGPQYDAVLHALFVGFVFAMIFGHAPVILPAVLRVEVPFHPLLYGHLSVLHGSLLLRLAGDALARDDLRTAGGVLNAVVIVVFLLTMASFAVRAARARKAGAAA